METCSPSGPILEGPPPRSGDGLEGIGRSSEPSNPQRTRLSDTGMPSVGARQEEFTEDGCLRLPGAEANSLDRWSPSRLCK